MEVVITVREKFSLMNMYIITLIETREMTAGCWSLVDKDTTVYLCSLH